MIRCLFSIFIILVFVGGKTVDIPVVTEHIVREPIVVQAKDTMWETYKEKVKASCYGWGFHGKTTACGEKFNQWGSTCAHQQLKCGTVIRVTDLNTGVSEVVRVTDTGNFNRLGRNIDLSRGTMKRISGLERNLIWVKIEVMKIPE